MKIAQFFFLITVSIPCFAQDPVVIGEYPIKMKSGAEFFGGSDKRDMVPLVNRKTNDFALMLVDNKSVSGFFFNNKFEFLSVRSLTNIDKIHNEVLGGIAVDGGYTLFMSNSKRTLFSSITYDLATADFLKHEFTFQLEKEKVFDTYSMGDEFVVLTVVKSTSIVKAYVFRPTEVAIKTFDMSGNIFTDVKKDFYWAVTDDEGVTAVYKETYSGLDLASSKRKIFHEGKEIIFTMDDTDMHTIRQTRVVTLNLETEKWSIRYFQLPAMTESFAMSNSYIYDSKIFQIITDKTELALKVTDLVTMKTMKEYRANKSGSIDFKNTPIYQEGSVYFSNTEKSYDDTKKFLNKITDNGSLLGIAVNQHLEGFYELTVGAKKTFQSAGGGGIGGFTPGSTISTPYGNVTTAPTYNPTAYGYNSYAAGNTRTTYFKSIVDQSLEKTTQTEIRNVFDRIIDFEKDSKVARTVFKIGNEYFLGYYKEKKDTYYLVKF